MRYHYVSLGCLCAVSMELERIGLRQESLPFDWLISKDFGAVLSLVQNHFEGFLSKENLYQEPTPDYYYDIRFKIHSYHDFTAAKSLDEQYEAVREKYSRRIRRFYEIVSSPTVFIRYCCSEDVNFIPQHSAEIESLLKSFNPENRIIYISNDTLPGVGNVYRLPVRTLKYLEALPDLEAWLLQNSDLTEKQIADNVARCRKKHSGGGECLRSLRDIIENTYESEYIPIKNSAIR